MDPEMQRRAKAKAAERGISLAEYIRQLVAGDLEPAKPAYDITQIFDLIDEGEPTDIARDKDKLIGEAVWEDHLRSTGQRPRKAVKPKVAGDR
jgi:hypothetical protein